MIFLNLLHLLNEYLPIILIFGIIINSFKEEQFSKALSPIILTDSGIEISLNDEQSLNKEDPIDINCEGRSIKIKDEHPSNALFPIVVTEFGIRTSFNDLQNAKEELPIIFKVGGKKTFVIKEHSINAELSIILNGGFNKMVLIIFLLKFLWHILLTSLTEKIISAF